MKKTLCTLLTCFLFCYAFAQAQSADTTIRSIISDRDKTETVVTSSDSTFTKCKNTVTSIDNLIYGNTDLASRIDGSIPGIQVTDNGTPGATGNFLIRGFHTIDGNDAPLIILNGFPYYADLNTINSLDIESISVLKSADAMLQYGLRGLNGVIEINTKQTKLSKQPLKITIHASVGTNNRAFPTYSVIKDEKDYYETVWEWIRNGVISNNPGQSASDYLIQYLGGYNSYNVPDSQLINPTTGKLNPNAQLKYHGDNWQKEFQRTGLRHEYNLSALKNGDKGSILFSAGYLNEQGYIKATDFERFNTRINGQLKVTNWLKAGLNASFANTDKHIPNLTDYNNNPFYVSQMMPPIYPYFYRNAAGEKVIDLKTGSYIYDSGDINRLRPLAGGQDILSTLEMQQKENKNKNYAWVINPYLEFHFLKDFSFISHLNISKNSLYLSNFDGISTRNTTAYSQTHYSLNQKLLWKKQINKNSFNAALIYEKWNSQLNIEQRTLDEINGDTISGSGFKDKQKTNSLLGEFNYNYDNKYFIFGGLRKEWDPYFNESFKIWTTGAAWDIAQIKVLHNKSTFTQLKLWGKYGSGSLENKKNYLYNYPQELEIKPKTLDLGLDFALMQNRISGSFQVFNREGNNLPINLPSAPSTGVPGMYYSVGFKTQGAELNLSFLPILNNELFWNLGINLSHYKTKTVNLNDMPEFVGERLGISLGKPLYSIFAYKSMGVDPANGDELFAAEINGRETTTSNLSLATLSYQGCIEPDLYGGFSNRFIYKNWDLSFKLTFALGGKYYDQVYQDLMQSQINTNWSPDILNSWTPENPNTSIPKLSQSEYIKNSRFITSASYLKISDITLAYAFNQKKVAQMKLGKLSIYIAAHNLWMFSARKGLDPQTSFYNNDTYDYAPMRTIVFGIKLAL